MSQKGMQILSTFILMMIFIYLYSIFGFYFVDHTYFYPDAGDVGERTCTNLW